MNSELSNLDVHCAVLFFLMFLCYFEIMPNSMNGPFLERNKRNFHVLV
jgi:hypothetical protein